MLIKTENCFLDKICVSILNVPGLLIILQGKCYFDTELTNYNTMVTFDKD